mmetsp:Transcript_7473/g.17884  ORF Transcript_7473/g.17884 Transcript_7473/m.17884 type:complete len:428 (-) Transcript_7473:64-1347(-)
MHRPVAVASASFSPVSFANLPNAPQAAVCHAARAPTAGPEEARGSSSVSLPVKLLRWDSAGAGSLSTQEPSASSSQLAVGGSIAASAANSVGDAQVGALRCEIEGLRAELDALKSLLDEGLQQREEAERSQSALISKVEQLSQCKLHAEQQMREAQAESQWLRKELALARRQELENCGEPDANNVHPPPTKPPLRSSSWSPPPQRGEKAAATAPPSPKHSARNRGACSSEPRSFAMARSASLKPPPEPQLTDEVDEMWRSLLQRFPQHPHWCLVKEKRCVYRMGSQTGKKILCRVTHGGLQVRVGGGWMAALSFLERYGPMNMGRYAEDHQFNCASVDVPASMERLLVPTKSWAQRIGISKSPDIREQRRMQDKTVEELPEEARSFGAKMAWSNVAKPDEEVDECEKAHSALQPLPWPGDTRSAIER